MTSKLTREWLKHQISAIEAVGITDSNTLAAFKLALAAMDSEPVAWRYRTTDINGRPNPHWSFSEEASLMGLYQPLYAAQPAPVVPDEKSMPNPLSMYAVDAVAAIAEVKGWNACRAAMLAAAPQELK